MPRIILKDKLADLRNTAVPQQSNFDPKNRVEYQLLSTAVTLQGYKLKAQRSGYYPSLAGFLNYSGNVQTQAFSDMFKGSELVSPGYCGYKVEHAHLRFRFKICAGKADKDGANEGSEQPR